MGMPVNWACPSRSGSYLGSPSCAPSTHWGVLQSDVAPHRSLDPVSVHLSSVISRWLCEVECGPNWNQSVLAPTWSENWYVKSSMSPSLLVSHILANR